MPKESAWKLAVIKGKVKKSLGGQGFEASSVLKSTEKAAKTALLIQERCNACHGRTVRDVLGSMLTSGNRYRMADLKYDLKQGRLQSLPPGSSAGALPVGKVREDAPCAGKPFPPASTTEFLRFLQCQLRFEAKHFTGKDIKLVDKDAEAMFPQVETFITPNLGLTERWVPYHTVLGVHELFLVQSIHSRRDWNEKQRFLAVFVFRAHCKRDLFTKAQLPLMIQKNFWKDPAKAFEPGGTMEKAILSYRKRTGSPLITSCFRIIPERILKDDTENLVRSVTNRSMRLLEVAELVFPIMRDNKKSPVQKMNEISTLLQNARGLGETWAKMITVCLDLAYPKSKLLESQCDVGTGAVPPLRCLLPKGGPEGKRAALTDLLKAVNLAKGDSAKHFWTSLKKSEMILRSHFKKYPLVCSQANTKARRMSAVTLQVQLCEYRQFRHSLARNTYGLPEDETMRGEPEKEGRIAPETFVDVDTKRKCVFFEFPSGAKKVPFEVSFKSINERVAARMATMCFQKMRAGESKQDVTRFRDDTLRQFCGGDDVRDDSEAWEWCKTSIAQHSPAIGFQVPLKNGKKIAFQTTTLAAGGSILDAERIGRLCYEKLRKGASKDAVLEYRTKLYAKLTPKQKRPSSGTADSQQLTKRQRVAGA